LAVASWVEAAKPINGRNSPLMASFSLSAVRLGRLKRTATNKTTKTKVI
jgi:hypothetical protein